MVLDVKHLREEYSQSALDLHSTDADPLRQFQQWFEEAVKAEVPEPNALTLSTIAEDGRPRSRVMLLKQADERGFVFFTNYESDKGREMAADPRAALNFLWLELQRQVRIEGTVERIPEEESTEYFQSRPKGSQIGAWASNQSSVLESREALEEKAAQLTARYRDAEQLPKPDYWGGFVLKPILIEFWQGRASRLHDRIQYTRDTDGRWVRQRLSP